MPGRSSADARYGRAARVHARSADGSPGAQLRWSPGPWPLACNRAQTLGALAYAVEESPRPPAHAPSLLRFSDSASLLGHHGRCHQHRPQLETQLEGEGGVLLPSQG